MPFAAAICALMILASVLCGPVRRRRILDRARVEDRIEGPAEVCATRPGPTAEELIDSAVAWVDGVMIREIVAVDDDLVVAFAGGPGAWFLPGHGGADNLGFVRSGWLEANVPLHIPWPLARRRALSTLSLWRFTGEQLQAFISVQHGLVGLAHRESGMVYAAPLESLLVPAT